jgi:prophage DNA circulation protein
MPPWSALTAILKQTPLILAAADAVLTRSRQKRQLQANAELSKQLADHASAMADIARVNAAKARQAFVLAIAAIVMAVAVLLFTWLR